MPEDQMDATAETGPAADRKSWQDLVNQTVLPFGVDVPAGGEFEGRITSTPLLDTRIFSMHSGLHAAERTTQHVQGEENGYCVVSFQSSGTLHLSQFGRKARVDSGSFALYTSDAPVLIEGSRDYGSLSLKIPLSRFRSSPAELHDFSATSFAADGGLAPAVWSFLKHLEAGNRELGAATRSSLSHHVVSMVEQMIQERGAPQPPVESSADTLREQCLAYIESQLSDPELTPGRVAAAAFISTRYLHQLFSATDTTVARHIRQRRLERVREDLASPLLVEESIEQLIRRWGVENISYFGQVFRQVEGCTPAEYRRRALGHFS
ncbi:helix-turn-helix domain-containing protein [Corynebacterium sp. A21]|uniref:helix-turn-helix domain-containing protein n=1 Tax=Corynebacterium sp. A21 TaxID=3457318 RepID=UPI003FD60B61